MLILMVCSFDVVYCMLMHCVVRQRVQGSGDNDETGGFSEKPPTAEDDEAGPLR